MRLSERVVVVRAKLNGFFIQITKHFIGDGATADGVDQGDARIGEAELAAVHGAGYRGTLGAGAQTVMVSFNSWQGKKLHGHEYLLNQVLKGRLGFDGIVVSDWNGIGQVSGCSNADCVPAVLAGIDLFMVPEEWKAFHGNLLSAVKRGQVPAARIDDAVRRILRVKLRAGLLDAPRPSQRLALHPAKPVGVAEHRALARRAVRESLVLLKNNKGLLPLKTDMHVLVAGDGADDIARQSGGWTLTWQGTGNSNADFPGATSVYKGIADALQGRGSVERSLDGNFKTKPDAAIVVIGEEPYAEGQGDRRDLNQARARPADLALLKKLKAQGIPVVTVLLSGRPLWTNPELNQSDAFVAAWLPGSEGAGIADVLFRKVDGGIAYDFTGRLPFRWPAWSLPVTGNTTTSANGAVTVSSFDRKVQEDSRRVVWNGSGVGQVFLNSTSPQDLTALRKAGGALVIDMLLESRPTQPVELRIDCGYPCGAKGNLSDVFKRAPLNTWFSLSMDLYCFEKAGADLKRVDTGMLIATSGKLSLGITGVRMVPGMAGKAVIRCEAPRE